jgi:DNA mismatch repair protein MutL
MIPARLSVPTHMLPPPTGRVRILPDSVINKIAAGEVIERPASVVKELVENSLDAAAQRVEVEVEAGGRALIRVADDGSGMSRDDALLSLHRHATSKIRDDQDLFAISTLGFRGEAIPSIAEISRFEVLTGERGAVAGTRLIVDGGSIEACEDGPNPGGTEILVRRLFWNVPVRLKFLKAPPTESGHITDTVTRLALARPDVAFRLVSDGRTVLDLAAAPSLAARAAAVLGPDARGRVQDIDARSGDLRLLGLVSDPSLHRATAAGLYLYVNGRPVKDRTMTGAVLGAYKGVIPRGRYPVAVLFIELPTDRVDVNVHPAKAEVRFRDSGAIWGFFRARLTESFKKVERGIWETPEAAPQRPEPSTPPGPVPVTPGAQGSLRLPPRPGPSFATPPPRTLQSRAMDLAPPPAPPAQAVGPAQSKPDSRRFSDLQVLGQLDGTFLLCQQGHDLVVIDQHAAHERVVFEHLRTSTQERPPISQRLLLPELVEMDRATLTVLADRTDLLGSLGLEVAPWGEETLAVHAVPAGVDPGRIRRLLRDVADQLLSGAVPKAATDLRWQLASVCACHTAVRAGDRLSADEVRALFRQLDEVDFGYACPHGRPLMVRFPRVEVERWFHRD